MTGDISQEIGTQASAGPPSGWDERVGAFAVAVGRELSGINEALAALCGEPGDQALAVLADPAAAPDNEIIEALSGDPLKLPRGVVRKNLAILRGPQQQVSPAGISEGRVASFEILLPSVPDDESFLSMLKAGGELKVGTTEVISAVRASLASRVGLYGLPSLLIDRMETFAEQQDEPCPPKFYELQKMVVQRNYAEIFTAINVDGRFVSQTRKTNFLNRLDETLWPSMVAFQEMVKGWQESWMAGIANPGILLAALAMGQSGQGALPAGMMQAPDTGGIRDAAEGVIDKINRVFAGMGIPVARALAYDAGRIKQVMADPNLPTMVGASNRDHMLKMLGVAVAADYVRLETNITRYALAIMELKKVPSGPEEQQYLSAMIMLGGNIPWNTLLAAAQRLEPVGSSTPFAKSRKSSTPVFDPNE